MRVAGISKRFEVRRKNWETRSFSYPADNLPACPGRLVRRAETIAGGEEFNLKKQLFDDLVVSIKQAGKIHRGEAKPSRAFVFQPEDVPKIRKHRGKSVDKARPSAVRHLS